MKSIFPKIVFFGCSLKLVILCLLVLASGCVSNSNQPEIASETAQPIEVQIINQNSETEPETGISPFDKNAISVIRSGRYTLIEVGATNAQNDVLEQIIDLVIPSTSTSTQNVKSTTVADAMRYVLLQSGYQLCPNETTQVFEVFSLPLVHRHLGQMTIQEALTVLAGQGWQLKVNRQERQVCFFPDAKTSLDTQVSSQEINP